MVMSSLKKRRHRILISGLLFLALLFSGCGEDPRQGLPGGAAPAVIELWHTLKGTEAEALMQEVQKIMDRHPEVIIYPEYVAEEKIVSRTYYAQAGGEGPEIILASAQVLNELLLQGALAPVLGESDSFVGLENQFKYGEKLYAHCLATDVPLFYYRTDLAEPPGKLEDLFASKGVLAVTSLTTQTFAPWWLAQGGKLASNGQPTLNNAANFLFLQQLLAWQESKLLLVDPNAWNLFLESQAAYTIAGAGQAQSLSKDLPWGSMPLNQLTAGQGGIMTSRTIGIANSSIKSTEDLKPLLTLVMSELLSPDAQWAIAQGGKRFPASSSFYSREEAQTGVLRQVGLSLAQAWSLPENSQEKKYITIQDQAWQNVWNGVDPVVALAQAQESAQKSLEKGE